MTTVSEIASCMCDIYIYIGIVNISSETLSETDAILIFWLHPVDAFIHSTINNLYKSYKLYSKLYDLTARVQAYGHTNINDLYDCCAQTIPDLSLIILGTFENNLDLNVDGSAIHERDYFYKRANALYGYYIIVNRTTSAASSSERVEM